MILKTLGLSQLVYSASNLQTLWKRNLSNFSGETKKEKVKRSGMYQDLEESGIRMTDINFIV